jgi:hypothetical protein
MISWFPQTTEFINQALSQGSGALVHWYIVLQFAFSYVTIVRKEFQEAQLL